MKVGMILAWTLAATVAVARPATPPAGPPLDTRGFFAEVDANRDGSLSHAEWRAKALPESAFGILDKNKDDAISRAEMISTPPPPGIDADGDGRLSVAEFVAFDRRMSRTKEQR